MVVACPQMHLIQAKVKSAPSTKKVTFAEEPVLEKKNNRPADLDLEATGMWDSLQSSINVGPTEAGNTSNDDAPTETIKPGGPLAVGVTDDAPTEKQAVGVTNNAPPEKQTSPAESPSGLAEDSEPRLEQGLVFVCLHSPRAKLKIVSLIKKRQGVHTQI